MRRHPSVLAFAFVLGTAPLAAAQADPPVELIEAGAEPREVLRHRFVADQTQPIRVRVQRQIRMAFGTQIHGQPTPVVRMDLDFGPTRVTDGHLRSPFRVTEVGISGGESEGMNARVESQIQTLVGARGETEMDERGEVVDFSLELPEGASPGLREQSGLLRDALSRIVPRFPAEPVGVGALWRVVDDLPLQNMTVRIGTTYRLVSRHGDRIELEVSTSVLEDAPNPANIDISGWGRLRFEIGSLLIIGRVQTVAAATLLRRSAPQRARLRIRTRMQITPR